MGDMDRERAEESREDSMESDDDFEEEEEDDEEYDDEEEDEEEEDHNGNAPPGLVRVKLHRDSPMTKVKLFDPETMENEHDLKQEPAQKENQPPKASKMV